MIGLRWQPDVLKLKSRGELPALIPQQQLKTRRLVFAQVGGDLFQLIGIADRNDQIDLPNTVLPLPLPALSDALCTVFHSWLPDPGKPHSRDGS